MNKLDCTRISDVMSARSRIQELYPAAQLVPWEKLREDNRVVFTDPQTSLSVMEMQTSSENVVQLVVECWERSTTSIYKNFQQFKASYKIANLMYSFTKNSNFTEIYHLNLCGNQKYGIQGLLLWEQLDPTTIRINCLMTSPVNIPSPITNPTFRVKRVGETCVHYLQQFCGDKNFHCITLSSLIPAIPFYERCGFQAEDILYDDTEKMNWTRNPSPIAQL